MKILLAAIGIATPTLWTGAAGAAPTHDPLPTVEVRYADLDLTKANDKLRLKDRLSWAASVLCEQVDNAMPVPPVDPICYRMTFQHALQQMDREVARAEGRSEAGAGGSAAPHR